MPKCILTGQIGQGGGGTPTVNLDHITATTEKTQYVAGNNVNTKDFTVTAFYRAPGTTSYTEVQVYNFTVSPEVVADGDTKITITYAEGGVSKSTDVEITVIPKLTSIQVTTNPSKMSYEFLDTFDTTGMIVIAHYSNGATKTLGNAQLTYAPTQFNVVNSAQDVVLTYVEDNQAPVYATVVVEVNRKSVAKPTWKANVNYNGSAYSVDSSTYWNNYDLTYFSIGGTTSATNAGGYTMTFTPGANYRWADGTTNKLDLTWTINRISCNMSINKTKEFLENGATSTTVVITRTGDGAISWSPATKTGLTFSLSGTTLTITGDGTTDVDAFDLTITVAQGTNWLGDSKIFNFGISNWTWGSESATADANWFKGLKSYMQRHTTTEINNQGWKGKTKSVTLSSAVQGTTTHLIRCIDVNKDGDKTATFQTKNCLTTAGAYASSSQLWPGSTARSICTSYYNAFPGKAYIKTVSKITNGSTANETVFLPSILEMGLTYSYAPSGEYTSGVSSAYSYYTSNTLRVKNQNDSSSTAAWYWTRSRYTGNSIGVCFVSTDGSAGNDYYDGTGGRFAPAFVIG